MEKELPNAKFKEYIEKKVRNTIRKHRLLSKDDKIVVAVSGGKDSTTVLYILKKLGYNIEALTIDAAIGNYTKDNLLNLREVCKKYDVKLHVVSFREEYGKSLCYIRSALKSKGYDYSSCMICGIQKRYLINGYSRKLKFDKVVTGHNLDDEAQAFLMNIFRNDTALAKRQGPYSGVSDSKKFVKRVKPLYQISEKEIIRYSKLMKFPVNYDMCPCSTGAYRREFRKILDEFEEKHPSVKYNVLKFHEKMILPLKNKSAMEEEINSCEICGEATSGSICKSCLMIREIQ